MTFRLDLHIDAIIGAVFGATALALFVLALCCCVHKKRSKKGDRPFRFHPSVSPERLTSYFY